MQDYKLTLLFVRQKNMKNKAALIVRNIEKSNLELSKRWFIICPLGGQVY